MSNARAAGEPRTRLHIRQTEPGVWSYVVVQADRHETGPVGWGWSRSWSETLVLGLASLDVNTRFPLERSR